jgi:hypothetical protein
MNHHSRKIEGRHKRCPLSNAWRKFISCQFVEFFSCAGNFDVIALAGADAGENEATGIL